MTMGIVDSIIYLVLLLVFFGFLRLEYIRFSRDREAIRQAKKDSEATIQSYNDRTAKAPNVLAQKKAHQQVKKRELDDAIKDVRDSLNDSV